MLAACRPESLASANAQLLECFQAIGGKARRRDCQAGDALPRISRESRVGRRLQPLGAAETRLERDIDLAPERLGDESGRFLALAMVRIAQRQRALRHPMEAEQQALRLEIERLQLPLQVSS